MSNDNVLNVHEFVLAMHLIRGRMRGLVLPKTLPRCLTPPKSKPETPPPMSQQEKDAYLRVFQTLDYDRSGCIDGELKGGDAGWLVACWYRLRLIFTTSHMLSVCLIPLYKSQNSSFLFLQALMQICQSLVPHSHQPPPP